MTTNSPAQENVNADEVGHARIDARTLMPETGLKEYWYPAILAKDVRKKPKLLKIIDKEIVLWRGKTDVIAFDNACAHRGGMLHKGACWWPGTISCFYHGWTYNEEGEVVASLSEGPDCKIPGQVRTRVYPTRTLHGVVFIWTGDGEPAPIEEDVPTEFFDDKALILPTITTWNNCNWRQGLENILDSHFSYLHRNSVREVRKPIRAPSPRARRPEVYKGRALIHRRTPGEQPAFRIPAKDEYQRFYPKLGQVWPRSRHRFAWIWFFDLLEKRHPKKTLTITDPEWASGSEHLPGIFRTDHGYMYTRMVVPVGGDKSRVWYFHASKPASLLGRLYEMGVFYGWRNWLQNYNFSGQDGDANTYLYYDRPEYLSATDIQTVEWRRLVLQARGMKTSNGNHPNGDAPADNAPEAIVPEQTAVKI